MGSEHILTTADKSTASLIKAIQGTQDIPLNQVRKRIGKYKVSKAVEELSRLSASLSAVMRQRFQEAVREINKSFHHLDKDIADELSGACNQIDVEIIELFKKKREGKVVEHIRLKEGITAVTKDGMTVITLKR